MPHQSAKINIDGKLDKDTDLSRVQGRIDALNTTMLVDENNTEQAVQIVKGNDFSYAIAPILPQNKVIKMTFVYAVHSPTATATINYLNQNGGIIASATYSYGGTANATMLNALGASTAALAAKGIPTQITVGTDYFELELQPTGVIGAEWTVQNADPDFSYVVLQEARSISIAGEQHIIGKNLQVGVRFDWTTTQTKEPETVTFAQLLNVIYSNDGSGAIRVTTLANHGLVSGEVIQIINAPASVNANGVWSVLVIDNQNFVLVYSNFALIGSGGDIIKYVQGYGQIGAVTYDADSNVWTYTRLIGSKELNLLTPHQVDTHVENANSRYSMYFTDDYNVIRCFYYDYALNAAGKPIFITDGAINTVDPLGLYNYGSIGVETSLLLSGTNITFDFVQQLQTGGQIPVGNSRYTVCLLTENLTKTSYLDLSNPISAYDPTTATINAANIIGNPAGTLTSKVNQFLVTGIIPGLFKYIELVRVNYVGSGAYTTKTVTRELLSGDTITLFDRGDNAGTTDLDAASLLTQSFNYLTAKNIRAIDRRLIISNLTGAAEKDFSAWAQQFSHGLFQDQQPAVGSSVQGVLTVNEYQLPSNVYHKVGYMLNEVYRFGCKVKFKNGTVSNTFWVDDIIFNTNAFNNSGVANPNRRFATLPDYNLTDINATVINIPYVKFGNINFDYLIDGVPVRDLIDELIFERVELDAFTEEILATGMIGVSIGGSYISSNSYTAFYNSNPNTGVNALTNIGESPFCDGDYGVGLGISFWHQPVTPPYNTLNFLNIQPSKGALNTSIVSFYCPDVFLGSKSLSYASGDLLFNYGNPNKTTVSRWSTGASLFNSFYSEYSGWVNVGTSYQSTSIFNNVYVPTGGSQAFGATTYYKDLNIRLSGTFDSAYKVFGSYVIETTGLNNLFSPNADFGRYYGQYYRNKGGSLKFGKITDGKYVPVGTNIPVFSTTPNINNTTAVSIFGGDTFTQKTYLKTRYYVSATPTPPTSAYGSGMAFYSQNKTNTQMKEKSAPIATDLYPALPTATWLESKTQEELLYNHGYDIQNGINSDVAYDPNAKQISDFPTRIAYSDLKPAGSIIDFYRYILPFNFHDLDPTQGEIMHHDNFNGELVTWQLFALQRQFFNSRGVLATSTTQIVIGDGSVMTRDGVRITGYGTQNKWSVIKGKSKSGDDTFVWVNAQTKSVQHLGLNGLDVISESKDMNSWFNKNLTWCSQYDTPANGQGIHGVWYENNNQYYFTFLGKRNVQAWTTGLPNGYPLNAVVSYTPTVFSTFEQTGEIYRSKVKMNFAVPTDTTKWELIPHTDRNYYNEYTLAFTNFKGVYFFTEFFTFKPKIYMEWGNTFQSPRPISDTGLVYLHWEGNYCEWYNDTNTLQAEDGYIELVYNTDTDLIKQYLAVLSNSEFAPYRIEFETKGQKSFIINSDFQLQNDIFVSPIKNDTIPTGNNNDDTSRLFGQYMKIKIYFQSGTYQKLNSLVLKYFAQTPLYTK